MSNFEAQAKRLIDWCKHDALPLWADNGVDKAGGFFEDLALDASPNRDSLRRVRVQARQVYVYSHAAYLGWFDGARSVSDHGWAYLTTNGFQGAESFAENGFAGCAHLLNPDGSLHDSMRDTYAQAFVMLASIWRYRAFYDRAALTCLKDTLAFLNAELRAENGGWLEGIPHNLPRRQNPHMHLFEAFLAAYESTNDKDYLRHADHVFGLFKDHFFEPETGTLLEHFNEDWSPDGKKGTLTEPGHMMEWCWLINWYARLSGQNLDKYAERLYSVGVKIGTNGATGLLVNETDLDGGITDSRSRLWIQTEYIKANISRIRNGYEDADGSAADMIDRMFTNYLEVPVIGGWHDQRDAAGEVTSFNMPSSTFYHIFCAAAEAQALLDSR